jgi:hypothetical protein
MIFHGQYRRSTREGDWRREWRETYAWGKKRQSGDEMPRHFETHSQHPSTEIHNRWVSLINTALKRDILLTDRIRFGTLAIKKKLVLHTWSGTLLDEESLLDDWIKSKGVLVGMRPTTLKDGVG